MLGWYFSIHVISVEKKFIDAVFNVMIEKDDRRIGNEFVGRRKKELR